MKLKRFKERDNKRIGIVVFTIACVMLVSGVVLYRTFAIFEVKTNQNVINGQVQSMGDLEFAFYQDDGDEKGDHIVKTAPEKGKGYSLDTSSSYCVDVLNGTQVSNVNWNDEKWSLELKNISTTKTKCYLHFKKDYKDQILNGADPDLMNGRLVPVKISATQKPTDITYPGAVAGKVEKADITKDWYNYGQKQWANAVILKDGKVDDYKPGDEILEGDIEAYFVWIPRYKYKLKASEETLNGYTSVENVGNVSSVSDFYSKHPNQATSNAFDIVFETKDKGNTQNGEYITHPAFVSFDSNGLWVGKFETGYNQNTDNSNVTPTSWNVGGATKNEEKAEKVIIKPHVHSWRGIQVANAFYTAYNYQRELESHMMKNSEWGAVAYLTQSIYGRCNKIGDSVTCDEVNRNNSSSYITGMSTTDPATCGYTGTQESCNYYGGPTSLSELSSGFINSYYLKDSQGGSTTGNYSGIYDMSGGAYEYVMGVMQAQEKVATPASGRNKDSNSGFKGPYSNDAEDSKVDGKAWPSSKYYDLYDYNTTDQDFKRGHLGDGTKEFGPFYQVTYTVKSFTRRIGSYNGDAAFFVYHGYPWFIRGGGFTNGTETGVGAFDNTHGDAYTNLSFRVVCAP